MLTIPAYAETLPLPISWGDRKPIWLGQEIRYTEQEGEKDSFKPQKPGVHAYHKHPVLLLPSGPDKVWAL